MSRLTAFILRDGNVIEHVALDAGMLLDGPSEFIWIEVLDPVDGDFSALQERFQLHSLAVEDSMSPAQVPKVDAYDDQIFVVLKIPRLEADKIVYTEISVFLSSHHIITVHHGKSTEYILARNKFQRGLINKLRPDFIMHAVVAFVTDSYLPVVEMIEEEVLSLENKMLQAFLDRGAITRLFRLRRGVIHLQHVIVKMLDVCGKLANLNVPCIGTEVKPYLRDAHDNLTRINTMISTMIDIIRAVFEAGNLLEQQRQGIIIRQLSAWAAILGVPTAISGIYVYA
jgi:magnesium transporter